MASKRNIRRKEVRTGCAGKRAYPDRTSAWSALIQLRRATRDSDIHVYACRHCSHFHLGHSDEPRV